MAYARVMILSVLIYVSILVGALAQDALPLSLIKKLSNLIITIRTSDLAVGVPFKDIAGKADAGAMHVFYGTGSGLTFTGEQEWTKDTAGVPGTTSAGDFFGAAGY
jgi:hypothetical protein